MKVGLCGVGRELVRGEVTDTNTVWLARRLVELGLDVTWHVTVGDERDRVAAALRWLVDRCDAVVVSGGLGSTPDDVARSAVAELPAGAMAFEPVGTAPGFAVETARADGRSTVVYALPGDPVELRALAERDVLPDLVRRAEETREVVDEVVERLDPAASGIDEERLEQVVAELLRGSDLTVATAESCTAGAVTSRLAAVPGASDYLRGGLVAYATEVKSSMLGLDKELVDEHGPVSIPTTKAMARGAQELFDADVGLGVTCVAGPDPQGGRRVGTIVWALAIRDGDGRSGELETVGGRSSVQTRAALVVLGALRRHLLRLRSEPAGRR